MKKTGAVASVVVVLGIAYVGSAWYVGKRAQEVIEHGVDQANERLTAILGPNVGEGAVKVAVEDYRRHIFSSDVTYSVIMKGPDGEPQEYRFADNLQHGPFPWWAVSEGHFRPLLAASHARLLPTAATQPWFDTKTQVSPVRITTEVRFDGSGRSEWQLSPVEFSKEGDKLSFSGGSVTVDFANEFDDSTSQGEFESLSLRDEETGESLDVRKIRVTSTTTTESDGKVKIQSRLAVDALSVADASESPVEARDMAVTLDSERKDNLLDGALRYDFGRIHVGESDLGSLSLGLSGQRVDVTALSALTAEYDAIQARHGDAAEDGMELTDAEEAALLAKLMDVLASSPSVAVDPVIWKNDKGESRASLHLDLVRAADPAVAAQSLNGLLSQVLKRLTFDMAISKPMFIQAFAQAQSDPQQKPQLEMLGAMIFDQYAARLQSLGLVNLKDAMAAAQVQYENDAIVLNGQQMPVQEFLQRLLSAAM